MPEHVHLLLSEPERAPLAAITALLTPEGKGAWVRQASITTQIGKPRPDGKQYCSPLWKTGAPRFDNAVSLHQGGTGRRQPLPRHTGAGFHRWKPGQGHLG